MEDIILDFRGGGHVYEGGVVGKAVVNNGGAANPF